MKKLLIIILILTVALPLTGDELSIQIRVNSPIPLLEIGNIPLRSDLKNVQGYNPDPEGFLRHDGKYSVDRIDTPSKGKASMKKWDLYFYPNGNFLIKSIGTKGYKKIEPEAKCGFYKVVDSTLVKVNMYIMNYENKMRSMYTDYYRIVNDTTVQPIVHVDFRDETEKARTVTSIILSTTPCRVSTIPYSSTSGCTLPQSRKKNNTFLGTLRRKEAPRWGPLII